jgi:hypothetical protein
MDDAIIILICIGVSAILICMIRGDTEKFGFPFDTTPQPSQNLPPTVLPYCTDKLGNPIPCDKPCQCTSPSCQFSFPVPVLSKNMGAYSPSKWCPGPPMC